MSRTAWRRTGLVFAAVIVLGAAAAVGASRVLDWNRYTPAVAAAVKDATGLETRVAGAVGFSVLPAPVLRLGGVTVGGGGTPVTVRARTVELGIRPWPLFLGRIKVTAVAIHAPVIEVARGIGGLPVLLAGARSSGPQGGERSIIFAPRRVSVEDATVVLRAGSGAPARTLRHLDGTLRLRAPGEPYRIRGGFVFHRIALNFDAVLGPAEEGEAFPLKLSLWSKRWPVRANLEGRWESSATASRFEGAMRGEAEALPSLVTALLGADAVPAWVKGDATLAAAIRYDSGRLTFNDLDMQVAGIHVAGAGSLVPGAPPSVEVALNLETVNLDRLLGRVPGEGAVRSSIRGLPANEAESGGRTPGLDTLLAALPTRWDGVRIAADMSVGALIYRNAIVRDLRMNADLAGGAITVNEFSAQIPGGGRLWVNGVLSPEEGTPRFRGRLTGEASNVRGTLEWLGFDVASVPGDRLRKAALSGRITLSPGRAALEEARLDLDVSHLEGRMSADWSRRPSFAARLRVDRLRLDAYLPRPAAPGSLAAFDLDLSAAVGRLQVNDSVLEDVVLDAAFANGVLTVRDLRLAARSGLRAEVSGTAKGLATAPELDVRFRLNGAASSALAALGGGGKPAGARNLGPVDITGRLHGDSARAQVDAKLAFLGGTLTATGEAGLALSGPRYSISLSGRKFDLRPLARLLRLPSEADADAGDLFFTALVAGDGNGARISNLVADVAGLAVTGSGRINLAGPRPEVSARVETGVVDLANLGSVVGLIAGSPDGAVELGEAGEARTSDDPVRPSGRNWPEAVIRVPTLGGVDVTVEVVPDALVWKGGRIEALRLAFRLDDTGLRVLRMTARVFGGEMEMTARMENRDAPRAALRLRLKGARLEEALAWAGAANVAGGSFDAGMDLSSTGRTVLEMLAHLSGKGRVSMGPGTVQGFDLEKVNRRLRRPDRPAGVIDLFLAGEGQGQTSFAAAGGAFVVEDGIIRSDGISIEGAGGRVRAAATVDLPRRTVDVSARITLAGAPHAPPLRVRFEGPLDAPRTVFQFDAFQNYLIRTSPPGSGPDEAH